LGIAIGVALAVSLGVARGSRGSGPQPQHGTVDKRQSDLDDLDAGRP